MKKAEKKKLNNLSDRGINERLYPIFSTYYVRDWDVLVGVWNCIETTQLRFKRKALRIHCTRIRLKAMCSTLRDYHKTQRKNVRLNKAVSVHPIFDKLHTCTM